MIAQQATPQFSIEQQAALQGSVKDPVRFINHWLNSPTWEIQNDIVRSVANNRRTAVKSCHASGKTYISARLVPWWLASHKEAIVITTAPTANQVEKLLWAEVHASLRKSRISFPKPTLTQLKINESRYAFGFTTSVENKDEGVKFQGFHSAAVLIIEDEAPGVPAKIQEAIEGIMSSGDVRILLIGNPTIPSGPFYNAFTSQRKLWNTITISAFDTPNLVQFKRLKEGGVLDELASMEALIQAVERYPEKFEVNKLPNPNLTSPLWVYERYNVWGMTSPLFQTRVLGQFPTQSEFALISLDWIEKAEQREIEAREQDKWYAGLDVAGPGENETVLVIRRGPNVVDILAWPEQDPRGKVVNCLRPYRDKGIEVNVDVAGVGWGIYLHLRDQGFNVTPINVGESSDKYLIESEDFFNLKAQLYWGLRLRFEKGDVSFVKKDDITAAQLSSIQWKTNSRGQVQIESKEDAAKRGVESPDRAEAIMLAFARVGGHGLIDLWEVQAKQIETRPVVTNEPVLVETKNEETKEISKQQKDITGWLDILNQANPLAKPVIISKQPRVCPRCSNTGLTLFGSNWQCGSCGSSGVNDSVRNEQGELIKIAN